MLRSRVHELPRSLVQQLKKPRKRRTPLSCRGGYAATHPKIGTKLPNKLMLLCVPNTRVSTAPNNRVTPSRENAEVRCQKCPVTKLQMILTKTRPITLEVEDDPKPMSHLPCHLEGSDYEESHVSSIPARSQEKREVVRTESHDRRKSELTRRISA